MCRYYSHTYFSEHTNLAFGSPCGRGTLTNVRTIPPFSPPSYHPY